MSELSIGKWHSITDGYQAKAQVSSRGGREVDVTLTSPQPEVGSDTDLAIMGNGIIESRSVFAKWVNLRLKLGQASLTLDWANRYPIGAIKSNADDMCMVIDALPEVANLEAKLHSMATLAGTAAVARCDHRVDAVDLIAPAGLIKLKDWSNLPRLAAAFMSEMRNNLPDMLDDPAASTRYSKGIMSQMLHGRGAATVAEVLEMQQATAFDNVKAILASQSETPITVALGTHDRLVPADKMQQSLALYGLDGADGIVTRLYNGGHNRLVTKPEMVMRPDETVNGLFSINSAKPPLVA